MVKIHELGLENVVPARRGNRIMHIPRTSDLVMMRQAVPGHLIARFGDLQLSARFHYFRLF